MLPAPLKARGLALSLAILAVALASPLAAQTPGVWRGDIRLGESMPYSGNDLSREDMMRQVARLPTITLPILLPGISVSTEADDYLPSQTLRVQRFDGRIRLVFGDAIADEN